MSYKPLVNVEHGIGKQIKSWIENGRPEQAHSRLIYGGACYGGYIHLKTPSGKVELFPVNNK